MVGLDSMSLSHIDMQALQHSLDHMRADPQSGFVLCGKGSLGKKQLKLILIQHLSILLETLHTIFWGIPYQYSQRLVLPYGVTLYHIGGLCYVLVPLMVGWKELDPMH